MSRGLNSRLVGASLAILALAELRAAGLEPLPRKSAILQRFLANPDPSPTGYRALRHLDARNDHFDSTAWMDVWTEADAEGGFRYRVAAEGGSDYIRAHVFRETLDTEQRMWASGASDRAALTPDNYLFEERAADADGLASLAVRPRRKDVLLVDGLIFLNPDDGELVRMEGLLSKAPSFWTRRVQITRWYGRFAGTRMPTALESVANVRIAGVSTFRMTYEYESVNGERIGVPHLRTPSERQ
jgi:hypothetical protein